MSELTMEQRISEAVRFIEDEIPYSPEVGLILGSGLGVLADAMEDVTVIHYEEIPHFPLSTVEGHAGELLVGLINGKKAVLMKGRFHLYEGYDVATVSFPVRVMKALGVKSLLVTNAAGGINTSFAPGQLMLIRDHINFMFRNPLIGRNENALGVRFPDMSEAYSAKLRSTAREAAAELGLELQEGVYAGLLGPSYETPAEIRMLRTIGADAVGMSTVPEVIAARHAGIDVLGISCITNMAAGILDAHLSHAEVMETADRVKESFLGLVSAIIPKL
ncbi:purine-nucleoside phosphorylase [Paenibacillus mesophilus]|uniref:purine-nucleoside phosphorylase n=1 Tax=Paenibacillus mesophilus TaxID=2582849 RepID=UPI00110DCE9A|nr:purine-nucleoside phosphorylase [Paenibacillus mesophilus]TMV51361.1 purine-nucleoside phosphorylase [Paenibacillus mesophilus]